MPVSLLRQQLRQRKSLQYAQTDHEVVIESAADCLRNMQNLRFVEGRCFGSIGEVELNIDPVTDPYIVE